MGRKRPGGVIHISSSGDSEGFEYDDINSSQDAFLDFDSREGGSKDPIFPEDDSSSGNSPFDLQVYQNCVRNLEKLKVLKRKLHASFQHKNKKKRIVKKTNHGTSRCSVSIFMNVISALSPERKSVIERNGFGSLLMFNKAYVPSKFATWIARLVDSKSGEIIRDGKVISLTEDSVNFVLDLPLGNIPFPADSSAGREVVLCKFGKDRIPPISFFADKLINGEALSDEDLLVCFLIVALSCFLCPNTTLVSSPIYFGIFKDIAHIKEYKWCGFVLQWLLDHIKAFNRGRCQGIGGCLYYLAVVYLDHIDFRQRQVPDNVPRISVWKEEMIQSFSDFDQKSPGVYGFRPLLDYEKTCYFKAVRLRSISSADDLDTEFCSRMEIASGCSLPFSLKLEISRIIDKHCFDCGISLNMDVTSLGNVSKEFQEAFGKMMRHICRVDVRSKQMVLDVMKAFAEAGPVVDNGHASVSEVKTDGNAAALPGGGGELNDVRKAVSRSKSVSRPNVVDPDAHNVTALGATTLDQHFIADSPKSKAPARSIVWNPLCDISNVACGSGDHDNPVDLDRDYIRGDKENIIVPDSVSPSPFRHRSRLAPSKSTQEFEDARALNSSKDCVILDGAGSSRDGFAHITPKLSSKSVGFGLITGAGDSARVASVKRNVTAQASRAHGTDSSPVICTGSRTLTDSVRNQTKKLDAIYNLNRGNLDHISETPCISLGQTHGYPADSYIDPNYLVAHSDFKVRDSSTGGKVPIHGPRRTLVPNRSLIDEFVCGREKFPVSKRQLESYKAICSLAMSRFSSYDALYFGGLHVNYWALGDSMKPGGKVNIYVVAGFCYHLYCRPHGHPDVSKRHYFFPNVSDNLLKDHESVVASAMNKAFVRCSKSRPLYTSDLLYFPTFHEDHWFLFVVDIKDMKFVFLDCFFNEDDHYLNCVRDKMIPQFKFWWDSIVKHEMRFDQYTFSYPPVPKVPKYDDADCGIYTMMFMEYWTSPRSALLPLFTSEDIQNIRIMLANDLFFNHRNNVDKNRVILYNENEEAVSD